MGNYRGIMGDYGGMMGIMGNYGGMMGNYGVILGNYGGIMVSFPLLLVIVCSCCVAPCFYRRVRFSSSRQYSLCATLLPIPEK